MAIGGVALGAMSGLATACPPDSHKASCSNAQDEAQSEVPVGFVTSAQSSVDGKKVVEWVGNLSSEPGPGEVESKSIEVVIDNGEVTVIRNGKKLPESAFRYEDNRIVFMDESINEDDESRAFVHLSGGGQFPRVDDSYDGTGLVIRQPPVMIGVMMGEPDEALRAHLGLGDRSVIMIDDVLDGLPADEAGLREYDIVVAIDGDDDHVTVPRLTEILRSKKPGDELKLRVIRGGEEETVRVKLRAYSAKALRLDMDDDDEEVIINSWRGFFNGGELESRLSEMAEQLSLAGLDDEQVDKLTEQIEESMERALRGSRGRSVPRVPGGELRVEPPVAPDRSITLIPGPQGRQMFELHVPGGRNLQVPESMRRRVEVQRQGSGDMERRLEALERRMDEVSNRIESRMAQMMDRFEKLANRIEKSLDDR